MLRYSFDQALWPQGFVVRAFKPAVCLHSHLLLRRSSLPFASLQTPKMLRGSFDQALWPQGLVVRVWSLPFASMLGRSSYRFPAFKPLKCFAAASTRHSGHRHLLLERWSLPFASLQTLKCFAAASTRHSGHRHLVVRAFKPAVCLHSHLLLGRSSLPFASLQTPKMLRASCDQALWPAAPRHPGLPTPKMLHGSFDQALWPQAFVVRAFKPAVCLHGHLLLGRSSLPFASLQTLQMLCGSFDQALWPQASCC